MTEETHWQDEVLAKLKKKGYAWWGTKAGGRRYIATIYEVFQEDSPYYRQVTDAGS